MLNLMGPITSQSPTAHNLQERRTNPSGDIVAAICFSWAAGGRHSVFLSATSPDGTIPGVEEQFYRVASNGNSIRSIPHAPTLRGGGECGLNRVYLAAGCVCVGRTPRASCQIDPIWCSSVSGPRELNNLNPGASPYLNYLIGAGN